MTIVTVGSDLAKNFFTVQGVDATGKAVRVRPSMPRSRLSKLIAALPPCRIGMEACHRVKASVDVQRLDLRGA